MINLFVYLQINIYYCNELNQKNMKKALILAVLSIGLLAAMSKEKQKIESSNVKITVYEPTTDFHEDFDSSFVDATTDCIHLTFKQNHACPFVNDNPEFK